MASVRMHVVLKYQNLRTYAVSVPVSVIDFGSVLQYQYFYFGSN